MSDPQQQRTVYRITQGPEGYTEVKIPMQDLRAGDQFRMDEADGTPVFGPNGQQVFVAKCDGYALSDGTGAVVVTDCDDNDVLSEDPTS